MEQILSRIPKQLRVPFRVVRERLQDAVLVTKAGVHNVFLPLYNVSHFVTCDKNGHGLAELLSCYAVIFETVRQKRTVSQEGDVTYQVYFRYEGKTFHGGAKKAIRCGEIISVKFKVGDKNDQFRLVGINDRLPSRVFIFWEKKSGPGTIVPARDA